MINIINGSLPILGIVQSLYAIHIQRYYTRPSVTGAFFMLSLILWLFLLWADWINNFIPVWQTTLSRFIIFVMVGLIMYLIKVKRCSAY